MLRAATRTFCHAHICTAVCCLYLLVYVPFNAGHTPGSLQFWLLGAGRTRFWVMHVPVLVRWFPPTVQLFLTPPRADANTYAPACYLHYRFPIRVSRGLALTYRQFVPGSGSRTRYCTGYRGYSHHHSSRVAVCTAVHALDRRYNTEDAVHCRGFFSRPGWQAAGQVAPFLHTAHKFCWIHRTYGCIYTRFAHHRAVTHPSLPLYMPHDAAGSAAHTLPAPVPRLVPGSTTCRTRIAAACHLPVRYHDRWFCATHVPIIFLPGLRRQPFTLLAPAFAHFACRCAAGPHLLSTLPAGLVTPTFLRLPAVALLPHVCPHLPRLSHTLFLRLSCGSGYTRTTRLGY